MKSYLLMSLVFSVFSMASSAFAAPATIYNCVGKNTAIDYGSSVMFSVIFSEFEMGHSYTRQELEIVRDGWSAPEQPLTFNLIGKKNCKVGRDGVIDAGNITIEWLDSKDEDIQTKMKVEITCNQFKFKTIASCTMY